MTNVFLVYCGYYERGDWVRDLMRICKHKKDAEELLFQNETDYEATWTIEEWEVLE